MSKTGSALRVASLALVAGGVASLGQTQTGEVLPKGPWGVVEAEPIEIRLPASMVPDTALPLQPWVVEMGKEPAGRLLAEAGVDGALAEKMLSTYEGSGGGTLRPTAEMIRALEPQTRAGLYEALRQVSANTSQRNPHRFRRSHLDERLRSLSPDTVALVKEFLYERPSLPNSWLLADLPAVMQFVGRRSERALLIQAISEQESLLLRLKLDASSDSEALAEYWGRGGRRRDLEILIGSLADAGSPRRIDVLYLLPAFVRSFLLTYPRLENAKGRDCFWTSLNFFLPVPDDRLTGQRLDRAMVERYGLVTGPLQLGDMLVLWRPTGEAEHAAIYIAGDIYFTKNGNSLAMPWLFMHLDDILDRYDEAERTPLTHYRLKNLD